MEPQKRRASAREIEALVEAQERFMQLISVGHAPDLVELTISMAQIKALYILWGQETQMSDLASILGVSTSTVSELVERLVDAGLATRREDPVDRRHVVVGITEAGVGLLDRFRELGSNRFRDLISDLDASEVALVHRSIDLLTAAATRKEPS
jgi:DNA-binding MarR family transcriptional regulator